MKVVSGWVAAHWKLIVFAVGALITLAVQIWGTGNHWVALAILAATGLGVYQVPNIKPAAKTLRDTRNE